MRTYNNMERLDYILIEILKTLIDDIKRRSYDESGDQRAETEGRIQTLCELINEIKNKDGG